MGMIRLSEEQKRVVRRYATVWQLWRKGDRSFASLEHDMAAGYAVLVDGIAVDNRPGGPVISSDGKDPKFGAAIFGKDDGAVPDLTAKKLKQLRHYIIYLKGGLPIRNRSEP